MKTTLLLSLLIALPASAKTVVPPVETFKLPNGLTVMLREDHSVPLVSVSFRGRAGSGLDPAGKEGLAFLTAETLLYGTATLTEQQIDETTERLGADVGSTAGIEGFYVHGSVPTIDAGAMEQLLRIVADVLQHPSFPTEGVEKVRARVLGTLQGLVDDRAELASRAFAAKVFAGHLYGRPTSGTLASLAAITRDDMVEFHASAVVPDEAALGLAGDFEPKKLKPFLKMLFGDPKWGQVCPPGGKCYRACTRPKGESRCEAFRTPKGGEIQNALLRIPSAPDQKGTRIVLVDTGDASLNQAQIRLGAPIGRIFANPGWHAHLLATQILGGDFTARLNARLRVKEGLTYGARYGVDYDDIRSGAGIVSTYTSPKDVVRALRITREELARFEKEPIPEDEMKRVATRIVRGFVFRFETAGATLSEHLDLWQDQLPLTHLTTYTDKLAAVTPADLAKVMGEFPLDDVTIVVVANAALQADLEALAKELGGTFETMTPKDLGLEAK